MSIFNIFKKKKKYNNATFYQQENLIQSKQNLIAIFSRQPILTTNYPISYQGIALDKIEKINMINLLGEESYFMTNLENFVDHEIYFYRKNIEKFSLLLQVHFIKNTFFFASTKVSSEAVITIKDKLKLVNLLLKNYPDITITKEFVDFEFTDKLGNILFINDQIDLIFNYGCNIANNEFINHLFSSNNIPTNKDNSNLSKYL